MIQGSLKKMASAVLTTSMILGMSSMAFAKNTRTRYRMSSKSI